ncbi:hypothetical protein GW17_00040762, partial [Ensete ventricosum]
LVRSAVVVDADSEEGRKQHRSTTATEDVEVVALFLSPRGVRAPRDHEAAGAGRQQRQMHCFEVGRRYRRGRGEEGSPLAGEQRWRLGLTRGWFVGRGTTLLTTRGGKIFRLVKEMAGS